jgi:hypothetical protein
MASDEEGVRIPASLLIPLAVIGMGDRYGLDVCVLTLT